MRALIVGAGIGGLAVGVALRRAGWDVRLLERREGLRTAATGLTLAPRALAALDRLGLLQAVVNAASTLDHVEFRPHRGAALARVPLALASRRRGLPWLGIEQAALARIMLQALGAGRVTFGDTWTSLTPGTDASDLELADGRRLSADLIVGADGPTSGIAGVLNQVHPAVGDEYEAWQGIGSLACDGWSSPRATVALGPAAQITLFPVGGNRVAWLATRKIREPYAGDCSQSAQTVFGDWDASVSAAIAATGADRVTYRPMTSRPVPAHWTRGTTVLVGEAAHPALPFLGESTAETLEDAVALVDGLSRGESVAGALAAFQVERHPRAVRMVGRAQRAGRIAHIEGRYARAARDAAIVGARPGIALARLWARVLPSPRELG